MLRLFSVWIRVSGKVAMRANFFRTMSGCLEGVRICRQILPFKGFLEVALILIATCVCLPTTLYAQKPGFLSIDCGSRQNYTDSISLEWVTDNGTYIKTGKSFEMPPQTSDLYWYSSPVGFVEAYATFRYFPEGRSKYCYEVPTSPESSYLIRASFYLNASVLEQGHPLGHDFLFSVYIDAINWFTIAGDNTIEDYYFVTQEGIFYSPNNVLYVCLQPVVGVPFINSLELRKLEDPMYSYIGSQQQYLVLLFRYNTGYYPGKPTLRYPDDDFDRLWFSVDTGGSPLFNTVTGTSMNTTSVEVNYVPPKVMQDGWLFAEPNDTIQATVFRNDPRLRIPTAAYAFAIMYTELLNQSDTREYPLNISLDGFSSQYNYSHLPTMFASPNFILSSNFFTTEMTLEPGENLTDGPTMNGCEVYAQYNFNFSTTNGTDAEAITDLKNSFSLHDWQGDPCLPVPYDWVSCSVITPTFQPITQPCNSNGTTVSQCIVQEGFLRSIYFVTAINLTNLNTSGFSLFTATPVDPLDLLTKLSITNSEADSRTFEFFIYNFSTAAALLSLDFSNNSIDILPDWSDVNNLTSLNLSQNHLADLLISANDVPLPDTLQNLNLSYNSIPSIPATWKNNSNGLLVLDLSHNQLSDGIDSLDLLVQMNNGSLHELDVSNNNLTGTISNTVYFSLPNLTLANFSQNSIGGTLNLTLWYKALMGATSRDIKEVADGGLNTIPTMQLFSFVNNNILDIVPDAQTFEDTFGQLNTNQGGVLLGGNPYCQGATLYTQQYLCRYSVNDIISDKKKKSKLTLILSIIGGVCAFILLCGTLATLWRMWKQIYALRAIQKALAKRKVQPPFYQYSDLRLGTKEFRKDHKLGHGSFGVVYKAILADGTMLAVKTLFSDKRLQNSLDEFLNEVVLITGIKHRNLVQLKGCCINDKDRMLVFEYVEKGNLAEALWGSKAHGDLNWEQRFNICMGVARGLAYLHEELQPSIIHRDIKPANILLDKNGNPKIADFGLARHFDDEGTRVDQTDIAGTFGYLAPEHATGGYLSDKTDVYSYGIVVLEIVSGRKCIDSSLPVQERFLKNWACNLIKEGKLLDVLQPNLRNCCISAEMIRAINIGLLCVQHRPERRPSMSKVVTMLSGNMDVEGFLGDSGNVNSSFDELAITIKQDIDYPVLQKLAEDSTMYPLLSLDSQSSISTSYGEPRTKHAIELGTIRGR